MLKRSFKTQRTRPVWSKSDESERRNAILRAAAGCFNRQGYHGTTIEDIAVRLNVTKGALYYYVRNKEEILFKCHQIALDIGMEGLRQAQAVGGTPEAKLKQVLKFYLEGVADELQGTVVLLEEGMLTSRHYREVVRRRDTFEKGMRAIVQEGIDDGTFLVRDPKIVVFAILGAANWVSKWYQPEGERSAPDIADILADYLVAGLCPLRRPADARRRAPRAAAARHHAASDRRADWRGHGPAAD